MKSFFMQKINPSTNWCTIHDETKWDVYHSNVSEAGTVYLDAIYN